MRRDRDARRGTRFPVYVRRVQRMRSTLRYVVMHALRRDLIPIPPLHPPNCTIPSLLMRQNFPLMSNNRTDFHFILSLVPLFSFSYLSLSLSLSLFLSLSIFSLSHTIIAFVPLRSLVVLNFHVYPWRTKKGEGGEACTYRFLATFQTRYRFSNKKRPSQKRARALACLSARN